MFPNERVSNLIPKHRVRCILNVFQMPAALGVYGILISIAPEFVTWTFQTYRFLVARQRYNPTDRWMERRDQQAVLAPRVHSYDCGRSESANAVCFEPFTMGGLFEITAVFFIDEHFSSLGRR